MINGRAQDSDEKKEIPAHPAYCPVVPDFFQLASASVTLLQKGLNLPFTVSQI
jgi:hypothetical protein